ncbi:sensor histidine kinase [Aneurinibacillus uraniidurans]|uniref:ATP-binding protein n=1 Tax=Aneurinibacillus uraniidurans TaxID=2966586 RepID=UPI00234BCEA1|nr:sensor histidine kinase [Aneurinibacillus sp. B1]WCN39544.1 ATP-binding protein [Aneurinibacillus sp. B1]
MNVTSGINHILLQILLILFPILLYHLYWGDKDLLEDKRKHKLAYGLISTVSIILCMGFAFPFHNGYLLDLRAVPLLIAFLYGGYYSGLFVTVVFLAYRYYLGGEGACIPLLVSSVLVPSMLVITPTYIRHSSRYKILLATVITICTSFLIAIITYIKLSWTHMQIKEGTLEFFIGYGIIQVFTMWITVSLIESLREKAMITYQLRQSDQLNTMSELAASVAHEIRNPLTVVRGFMQLFTENKQIPEDVKPYIGLMISEVDRTQEIIINFLSLAKPKLERIEKISVAEHIQHIKSLMYSYAILQNVDVQVVTADLPYIETDPDKFSQVLINIIKNGIEAMPSGGELKISVKESKDMAEICIKDQGVGMTEEEVKRLGTLFYSTKTKGTGVGLMVSYRLIEKMNGQIEVKSQKEVGTQFTLKFPRIAGKQN